MTVWLTILGMMLVTFSIRLSVIVLLQHAELPILLQRALRFVPIAVLSAIVFPELLMPEGQLDFGLTNVRLLAGLAALLIAYASKHTVLTIVAGMILLWLLEAALH